MIPLLLSLLVFLAPKSFAQNQEAWSTLYSHFFAQGSVASADQSRVLLEKQFRLAQTKDKTAIAVMLLAIEEEEPQSGGTWSQWLLYSPDSKLPSEFPQLRCRALLALGASKFLQKDFETARTSFALARKDESCDLKSRDLARFQGGWILINQKKAGEALREWKQLLGEMQKDSTGRLLRLPLLKEYSRVLMQGQGVKTWQQEMETLSLPTMPEGDQEAVLLGAMESIAETADTRLREKQIKSSQQNFSQSFIEKTFPSSRLYYFADSCLFVEWAPADTAEERLVSKAERCWSKGSPRDPLPLLKFSACDACKSLYANIAFEQGRHLEACKASLRSLKSNLCLKLSLQGSDRETIRGLLQQEILPTLAARSSEQKRLLLDIFSKSSDHASFLAQELRPGRSAEELLLSEDFLEAETLEQRLHPELMGQYLRARKQSQARAQVLAMYYREKEALSVESFNEIVKSEKDFTNDELRIAFIFEELKQKKISNLDALRRLIALAQTGCTKCLPIVAEVSLQLYPAAGNDIQNSKVPALLAIEEAIAHCVSLAASCNKLETLLPSSELSTKFPSFEKLKALHQKIRGLAKSLQLTKIPPEKVRSLVLLLKEHEKLAQKISPSETLAKVSHSYLIESLTELKAILDARSAEAEGLTLKLRTFLEREIAKAQEGIQA
jgi:hypothetical protein